MSEHCSRSSSARRDLPIPGSPTSSTSVPKPMRTGATDAPSTARSRSRSTKGSLRSARANASAAGARQARRAHRLGLPLDEERLELGAREPSVGALEGVGADQDLVRLGARHQPCGQRGRVAQDRVGPAERGTHLAAEHAAAADSDVQRQR